MADVVNAMLDNEELNLQQERAHLAKKQTEKVQIQIDEMNGTLIPTDQVIEEWSKHIFACRAKLLLLPTKMTPLVFAATSESVVHGLLKDQIYEALNELAEGNE